MIINPPKIKFSRHFINKFIITIIIAQIAFGVKWLMSIRKDQRLYKWNLVLKAYLSASQARV